MLQIISTSAAIFGIIGFFLKLSNKKAKQARRNEIQPEFIYKGGVVLSGSTIRTINLDVVSNPAIMDYPPIVKHDRINVVYKYKEGFRVDEKRPRISIELQSINNDDIGDTPIELELYFFNTDRDRFKQTVKITNQHEWNISAPKYVKHRKTKNKKRA